MKKGLFLLLAIVMVGVTTVKADVAPPVIVDKHITVEVREGYDINDEDIQNIIFGQLNCSPSDLTPFDLNKLKKDIEKYYKEVHKLLF